MVNLKNTPFLFLFGDVMEEKTKKIKVEDLGALKNRYMEALDLAERKKRPYQTVGGKLMAMFSTKAKKTIIESDRIIMGARAGLRKIGEMEKKNSMIQRNSTMEKAQAGINWEKKRAEMDRERNEVLRQQQREREEHGGLVSLEGDIRMTRITKRRRR